MTDQWASWTAEIIAIDRGFKPSPKVPGTLRRDEPFDGYWRIMGAESKHDTPVLLWRSEGHQSYTFQIGRSQPRNSEINSVEWQDFVTSSWLKCSAVRKADWDKALETGFWRDGRPSRPIVEIVSKEDFTRFLLDKHDTDFNAYLIRRAKGYLHDKREIPGVRFSRKETA